MKKSYRLAGAFIMLSRAKYEKDGMFSLCNILYTKDELISAANRIPENARISVGPIDMNNVTIGIGSGAEKFFVKGSEDSLSEYYRLACPGMDIKYDYTYLVDKLIKGFPAIGRKEDIIAYLQDYFSYATTISLETQASNENLSTREAIWIAAANMTFNEFYRSHSGKAKAYFFTQASIANLAEKYNPNINSANYKQSVRTICTKGKNNQGYAYLIESKLEGDTSRRLASETEGILTKPESLPSDFVVNTILSQKTVSDLEVFVKDIYSREVDFQSTADTEENHEDHDSDGERQELHDASVITSLTSPSGSIQVVDYLKDVYISEEKIRQIKRALEKKYNIIMEGAPGVGKTFAARRIAYSIIGDEAPDKVAMVQFHQSYSYEDFMLGFRPTENGFKLHKGIFYRFCKKAEEDSDNLYFFIIDELNRGNISKIFGETFMLIENDKRDSEAVSLLYNENDEEEELFTVPENIRIIGLMNTADRSIAMMDYALKRRFSSIPLEPAFDNEKFKRYLNEVGDERLERLIGKVKLINEEIAEDDTLGKGFCIGHSYFCGFTGDTINSEVLSDIIDFELIPLLEEYWFEEPEKVEEWSLQLREAVR